MTYAELNARANAVAHRLRDLGVGPGASGRTVHPSIADLLIALLGIQKSGGAYVPLDPEFPAERLEYMLSDSGATVLVTAGKVPERLRVPEDITILDVGAAPQPLDALATVNPAARAAPQDTSYVIYTSGSTGRPKGVAVPHGALLNFLWSMRQRPGLSATDVLAAVTTISFDIAALELYLPLIVGARIELVSRETAADGKALSQLLAASAATVLQATPATWRMLLEADWPGRTGFRALSGGEPLPRDLADALLDRVDELWNLYGPTETTVWSTVDRVERGTAAISIGRPICQYPGPYSRPLWRAGADRRRRRDLHRRRGRRGRLSWAADLDGRALHSRSFLGTGGETVISNRRSRPLGRRTASSITSVGWIIR